MQKIVLLLLAFVAVASARSVFLSRKEAPKGWSVGGYAPDDSKVHFTIFLNQRNLDLLEKTFWAVSDPDSPQYRQFLKPEQISAMVAPPQSEYDTVVAWLKEHGITSIVSLGGYAIEVQTTAGRAGRLFHTKFHTFFSNTGRRAIRAFGDATMPVEINALVTMVEGVSTFPPPHYSLKTKPARATAVGGQEGVIPWTLLNMYNIPVVAAGSQASASQSVIEFEQQYFDPSDLDAFSQQVGINVNDPTASHTVGPNDPTDPQLEASLDIQEVATVNPSATSWFWIESGMTWLLTFGAHVANVQNVPQVMSISYGWSEEDQCEVATTCPSSGGSGAYVALVNAEFQKIGARGVSLLVASGDSGANGRTDPGCTLPYLKPDFPAASPYVTSVGATQVNSPVYNLQNPPPICQNQGYSCVSGGKEVAVSYNHAGFASGGGFSNYVPMPSYQRNAVTSYLTSGNVKLPPASYFNSTNRGYPDVAAIGSDVLIYQGGVQGVGGTSCSSPEFAAVVGMLNYVAMQSSGNQPLGFLNPLIYKMAAAQPNTFQDIVTGDNICTEGGCSSSCQGFYATKGWDPVTGFGSPNAGNMISYVANMLNVKL